MPPLELLGVFLICALIGGFAANLGLGGGILIVPFLVFLDLPIQQAAAVGLVCTLATSAAGSVALDKARLANLPLVANLEVAAVLGGIGGATVASLMSQRLLGSIFAVMLLYASWRMFNKARRSPKDDAGSEIPPYEPTRYPFGLLGFLVAGLLSGMLGIGGGPVKVPVQTEVMHIPLKVALANSNIMVGITAAAGGAVYFLNGLIPADVVGPATLGTALGAYLGGLLATRFNTRPLAYAFTIVLVVVALLMLWKKVLPHAG